MRTIGILAEYNPFHSGHRHHLNECRRLFGSDCAIVCVMSGNFVQRGDAAIADKWTRTRLALAGGADVVLELPTLWAAAPAEQFALGGVSLLTAAGVVDALCFGSEAGALEPLERARACLDSPALQTALRKELDKGLSFPAARQRAAHSLMGEEADCLRLPNNSLGIEYLRAIETLGSPLSPHTIPRLGAAHDDKKKGQALHVSASYLREQILAGSSISLSPYLSPEAEALLRRDPASLSLCTRGVLAKLRSLSPEDFSRLPDSGEGVDRRLYAAVRSAASLEEVYTLTKTKRYTLARIRRMVLWAFLGLTEEERPALPPYLRVLGFSQKGQEVLRAIKKQATLPLLTKAAHIDKLSPEAQRVFAAEVRCTELYDLCRSRFGEGSGKNEYTQNPVIWHETELFPFL